MQLTGSAITPKSEPESHARVTLGANARGLRDSVRLRIHETVSS
jgi:hypothetical protein